MNRANKGRQSGVYIIAVAMSLVVMLAVVGLGVDASRLYLAKRQMQSVVDSAALATARLFLLNPDLPVDSARSAAVALVKENLRRLSFSEAQIASVFNGDVSDGDRLSVCFQENGACGNDPAGTSPLRGLYVSANLTVNVPTTILGAVPFVSHVSQVNASALANNLKLLVYMVLDASGSMMDNNSGIVPPPGCPTCNKRGLAMKYAAKEFASGFLPADVAGLVIFSQNLSGSELPETNADGTVNWTNVTANYGNDAIVSFNALDMDYNNRNALLTNIEGIDLSNLGKQTNIGAGIQLGASGLNGFGDPAGTLKLLIVLSDGRPSSYSPLRAINAGPRQLPVSCGAEALMLPNDASRTVKLQMLDAIYESDLARVRRNLVYTIGLGDPDPGVQTPFQTIDTSTDGGALKPILMQRIANDQTLMRSPEPVPGWSPFDAAYPRDFPCKDTNPRVPSGADIIGLPNGRYLPAASGQDLLEAFWEIAKMRTTLGQLPL